MICTGWDLIVSGAVRYIRQVGRRVPLLLAVLIAVILFIYPVNSDTWQGACYERLLVPPALASLVLYRFERGTCLRILLCNKAVGTMSYGIYLWQQMFTTPNHDYQFGSHILVGHVSLTVFPLLFVIVPLSYFGIAIRCGRALPQKAIGASVRVGANQKRAVTA
jgi:peptidoglycan/LPS O-acetylase OafA/YrhL